MRVVDMHCDTISELLHKKRAGKKESLRKNSGHLDLERMKSGGYLLQNFALFVELHKCHDPWEEVQALVSLYQEELAANAELAGPVYDFADIAGNEETGRMSAMLTVEEGGVCGGSVEKLRTLYEQGVRMMTLSWNYPNELGSPNLNKTRKPGSEVVSGLDKTKRVDTDVTAYLNTPNVTDGLTETGFVFLEEMERLGMIIDVSHMSDAGFYDVLTHTEKPFVASHSNARSVCPCVRNLTDDMIRCLAERGGVTGLNFCADFLTQLPSGVKNPGTVEAVVAHARHIVNMGGMECLGLGSDFDGIDTHEELPGADKMERLFTAMKKSGFTESELDRIFYKNVLRVYREVLK